MFERGMAMTRLVVLTKGSGMSVAPGLARGGGERPRIGDDAGDSAGGRREGRGQEGPAAFALPSLEVAVRGADAVLAGLELVAVHGNAHRTARLAPLRSGRLEDLPEPLALGLAL